MCAARQSLRLLQTLISQSSQETSDMSIYVKKKELSCITPITHFDLLLFLYLNFENIHAEGFKTGNYNFLIS